MIKILNLIKIALKQKSNKINLKKNLQSNNNKKITRKLIKINTIASIKNNTAKVIYIKNTNNFFLLKNKKLIKNARNK